MNLYLIGAVFKINIISKQLLKEQEKLYFIARSHYFHNGECWTDSKLAGALK